MPVLPLLLRHLGGGGRGEGRLGLGPPSFPPPPSPMCELPLPLPCCLLPSMASMLGEEAGLTQGKDSCLPATSGD